MQSTYVEPATAFAACACARRASKVACGSLAGKGEVTDGAGDVEDNCTLTRGSVVICGFKFISGSKAIRVISVQLFSNHIIRKVDGTIG
jgi:hypothetical protein